jgi:Na+:H+ antiporter
MAVLIARAVGVYLIVPLTMHSFTLPRISLSERHIMWWGGLKGGLAIAIVLSIPESMPERDWLIELTLGVVLFSLLVSGSTLKPLIHWLKIDALTTEEQAQLEQGLADVNASVSSVLHSFSSMHLLDREMHNSVRQRLAKTLKRDTVHLSEEQLLHHIHLQALQAEEEELVFLYEISLVNDYVYLTFKDIIRRDKEQSYSDLLNAKHDVGFDNSFLQMENILIEFLVEKKWLHGLLVRYQNIRFANQVRHDIAGVLMAHRALKAIKNSSHNDIREKNWMFSKQYTSSA